MGTAVTARRWDLADMPLEERIGQMIMVRYPDREILEDLLAKGHAGSFYFNMKGLPAADVAGTLNRLQALAKYPQIVAFGFVCADCGTGLLRGKHMRIGATRSQEIAYRLAYLETREQRAYGFHLPGMPVLDVNTNPANPIINTRAISDDAELVVELGLEMLRGIMDARGMTCTMHFPGHGATAHDSHIRIPLDERRYEELWQSDLMPYRKAIPRGLINGICTNHVHYPTFQPGEPVPSTVSRRVVTDLLRGMMGYNGVIMTDSLTMKPMKDAYGIEESAILAVRAGHDIILQDYQSDPRITHEALLAAVRSGRIPEEQVNASVKRIVELKEWMGLFENASVDLAGISARVATPEHRAFALRVARESVTMLENGGLPLRVSEGNRCVVITNGGDAVWDADMDVTYLPNQEKLYRALRKRLPGARTVTLSEKMLPEEISSAAAAAESAQWIVFGIFTRVLCYREDSIRIPPAFADLIKRTVSRGRRVALLNFGNPYTMRNLPVPAASLCTYDDECAESYEAAVGALFGEFRTSGKLPVKVSDRYPFGHGL